MVLIDPESSPSDPAPAEITPYLAQWRRACDRLATAFDDVMRQHIESIVGASPW